MLNSATITMPNTIANNHIVEQLNQCQQFPAMVRVPLPNTDALAWLDAQPFDVRFAWSERDDDKMLAGAGVAAMVEAQPGDSAATAIHRCRELLGGNDSLRFFGGLSFDGEAGWRNFGAGRFVAPRFLLDDGELVITVMDRDDVTEATLDLQQLCWDGVAEAWSAPLPSPASTRHAPTHDGWQSTVDEALTLIRSEVLEKVVLARKTTLEFDEPLNPMQIASRVADSTFDCFVFCFQFGDRAFVGATPERLFRRKGIRLQSEIVAGTRPRGVTSGEDQRLAFELLTSDKDQLEHDIVRKSIRQKLHKFVEHLEVDSHASVLRLAHKQHLCSSVQGELKEQVEEAALLQRLHPTPAVGGYPTENALPEIARLEPFNRGWYAAPIGWVGLDDAEFVVGIRSGLIEGRKLSLYSGAGIVKGSDPAQEWDEVENKIRDFVDVFK